jgi:hypothetical protein
MPAAPIERARFDSYVVTGHNSSVMQLFVPHRETNTYSAFFHAPGRSL